MKCIIIDHEKRSRDELKKNIIEIPSLQLVEEFDSTDSAKEFLKKNNDVNLMFLEIDTPGKEEGLKFLKKLGNPPATIVVTNDNSQAIEAFDSGVVDYVLKPIKLGRFIKAMAKVEEILKTADKPKQLAAKEDDFIFIKSERKYIRIKYEDLIFIEGLKDYVIVHATHGNYMTAMNVKTIHNKLPMNIFFRVSKSFIINIDFIDDIDTGYINIGEMKIPIGRSYREMFFEYVNRRLLRR
jgi:DNA-binding LytR/AlgR family response regulator